VGYVRVSYFLSMPGGVRRRIYFPLRGCAIAFRRFLYDYGVYLDLIQRLARLVASYNVIRKQCIQIAF